MHNIYFHKRLDLDDINFNKISIGNQFLFVLQTLSEGFKLLYSEFGRKNKRLLVSLEDTFEFDIIELLKKDINIIQNISNKELCTKLNMQLENEKILKIKEYCISYINAFIKKLTICENSLDDEYILEIS